jgi:hypothetical protein
MPAGETSDEWKSERASKQARSSHMQIDFDEAKKGGRREAKWWRKLECSCVTSDEFLKVVFDFFSLSLWAPPAEKKFSWFPFTATSAIKSHQPAPSKKLFLADEPRAWGEELIWIILKFRYNALEIAFETRRLYVRDTFIKVTSLPRTVGAAMSSWASRKAARMCRGDSRWLHGAKFKSLSPSRMTKPNHSSLARYLSLRLFLSLSSWLVSRQ